MPYQKRCQFLKVNDISSPKSKPLQFNHTFPILHRTAGDVASFIGKPGSLDFLLNLPSVPSLMCPKD